MSSSTVSSRLRTVLQRALRRWRKPTKLLILGLDSSGKTTLLYRIKLDSMRQQQQQPREQIHTIATIGFNAEAFEFAQRASFVAWDIGGSQPLLWRYYYEHTDALVFVIDSTDRERLPHAIAALDRVFADSGAHLRDAPLLVWANKQDVRGCMTLDEIAQALIGDDDGGGGGGDGRLKPTLRRAWTLRPLVATSARGVAAGLAWLASQTPCAP